MYGRNAGTEFGRVSLPELVHEQGACCPQHGHQVPHCLLYKRLQRIASSTQA